MICRSLFLSSPLVVRSLVVSSSPFPRLPPLFPPHLLHRQGCLYTTTSTSTTSTTREPHAVFRALPTSNAEGVAITDEAVRSLNALNQGLPEPSLLRISIISGGCSGVKYDFGFTTELEEEDVVFEREGARVVVDPDSLGYLKGAILDFASKDLMRTRFTVKSNPNAAHGCGCGTSFTPK